MNYQELKENVQDFVERMNEGMKSDAEVRVEIEEPASDDDMAVVFIDFEGDDLGYMIGSGGRHLRALQFVLSIIVNNSFGDEDQRYYVNVDVGGYKREKDEEIEQIALQKAEDARILGEPVDLEPMNAAQRRVVHSVLTRFDDVETESHGEGADRAVRIIPISEEELGIMEGDAPTEMDEESEE